MDGKVKFAVIGFGHIGRRHASVIHHNPLAQLTAVADAEGESLTQAKEQYDVSTFTSLNELLESNTEFDVLNICTPNGLHCEQALLAIRHGKHVVIEKPMGLHAADCEAVIEASKKMNRCVFCVMQNRYTATAQWLQKIIEEKRLGKIYHVSVNCFWNRDERYYLQPQKIKWRGTLKYDGGPLFTQFSHFADLLLWVFGEVKIEKTFFSNHRNSTFTEFADDSGMVFLSLKDGGNVSFQYSTAVWDKNLESSITVIAENGSLKIGGQYMEHLEYCHIKNYFAPELNESVSSNQYPGYSGSAANHQFVIQNVIDVLHGKTSVDTSAEEGMKVVKLIETIYKERK